MWGAAKGDGNSGSPAARGPSPCSQGRAGWRSLEPAFPGAAARLLAVTQPWSCRFLRGSPTPRSLGAALSSTAPSGTRLHGTPQPWARETGRRRVALCRLRGLSLVGLAGHQPRASNDRGAPAPGMAVSHSVGKALVLPRSWLLPSGDGTRRGCPWERVRLCLGLHVLSLAPRSSCSVLSQVFVLTCIYLPALLLRWVLTPPAPVGIAGGGSVKLPCPRTTCTRCLSGDGTVLGHLQLPRPLHKKLLAMGGWAGGAA